jgi:hypothetical protein
MNPAVKAGFFMAGRSRHCVAFSQKFLIRLKDENV